LTGPLHEDEILAKQNPTGQGTFFGRILVYTTKGKAKIKHEVLSKFSEIKRSYNYHSTTNEVPPHFHGTQPGSLTA
jgi:hypothetical protein